MKTLDYPLKSGGERNAIFLQAMYEQDPAAAIDRCKEFMTSGTFQMVRKERGAHDRITTTFWEVTLLFFGPKMALAVARAI